MRHNRFSNTLLFLTCFAGFGFAPATSRAATVNSSNVHLEISYTFSGAFYTDSGLPAEADTDFSFDGPPSHYFDFFTTFVFTEGDGMGMIGGSATVGGVNHTYPDDEPDFSTFDPYSESVTLSLETMGQSSSPGSNGSAAIESDLAFYVVNQTEDPGTFEPVSLTFEFDYLYTFSMALLEDSPNGGEGNGFIEVDASVNGDTTTMYPGLIQEFHGGPASIVDQPGSGTIQLITAPGESFVELFIQTNVNSTTLVPSVAVPEPSIAALGLFAVLGLGTTRRRNAARASDLTTG
tara:strand:- start:36293 stop:37168 length:876 start_codon:yes stop_codon:yes gene_type:complete